MLKTLPPTSEAAGSTTPPRADLGGAVIAVLFAGRQQRRSLIHRRSNQSAGSFIEVILLVYNVIDISINILSLT